MELPIAGKRMKYIFDKSTQKPDRSKIMPVFIGKIKAAFWLSMIGLSLFSLSLIQSNHSEAAEPFLSTAADFRLSIFATSGWQGRFQVAEDESGGLARLAAVVRSRRTHYDSIRGEHMLFHIGDFTGAENKEDFFDILHPEDVPLLQHLKFTSLALAIDENYWAKENAFSFDDIPAVSFNWNESFNPFRPDTETLAVHRFYLHPVSGHSFFISALTKGNEPDYSVEAYRELRREILRQSGADFYIILLSGRDWLESEDFKNGFLQLDRVENEHDEIDQQHPFSRLLIIAEGESHFRRMPQGSYFCQVPARQVCELDILFRNRHPIGVSQVFHTLTPEDRSYHWIQPDPALQRLFR